MEEKSLSIAFCESLEENLTGIVSEYAEIGLDAFLADGALKEIPIISTAVALYKIGSSLIDRHNFRKLCLFLDEINKGITDNEKREKYKEKFKSNDKFRNSEIEYLLVLINRYISYDKPQMLAKLYMAYLDGIIIWEEFAMYSEVVDRFLLLDKETLITTATEIIVHKNMGGESVLRLVALGLMTEITDKSTFLKHSTGYALDIGKLENSVSNDRKYKRTEFGEKLAQILI